MTRMMFALCFLIVAHNALCHTLLEVYEDMVEILLMQVFLAEDPVIEYLFCGALSGSETSLRFCNDHYYVLLKSV